MFCKNCGKENNDNASFCAGCGGNMQGENTTISHNNVNQQNMGTNNTCFQINDTNKLLSVLTNQMAGWNFEFKDDFTIVAKKGIGTFKLKIINNSIDIQKFGFGLQIPYLIIAIPIIILTAPLSAVVIIPQLILKKKIRETLKNALSIYATQ